MNNTWFSEARYGLFIHYGLYLLLERGEWVWNREEIPIEEYKKLADRFTAEHFDADRLCRMAVDAVMRNVVLTTMHQSGGLRVPNVPHPRYDPCPSDIAH